MKRNFIYYISFIITILIFNSNNCYGQNLDVNDVFEKLNCKDYNCYRDYIQSEKFCFEEVYTKNPKGTFHRYATCDYYYFDKKIDRTIKTKNYSSFGILHTKCKSISIGTSNVEDFKENIKKLRLLGYEIEKLNYNSISFLKLYNSKKTPSISIEIKISEQEEDGVGKWPLYYIVVEQMPC